LQSFIKRDKWQTINRLKENTRQRDQAAAESVSAQIDPHGNQETESRHVKGRGNRVAEGSHVHDRQAGQEERYPLEEGR